eukprot:850550-Pelagomonas_calceolata.AAC.2
MVSTRRSQQSQLSADTVPLQQNEVDIQSKPEGGSKAVAQVQQITPRTTRSSSRLTSPAPEQPPGSVAAKRQLEPITGLHGSPCVWMLHFWLLCMRNETETAPL